MITPPPPLLAYSLILSADLLSVSVPERALHHFRCLLHLGSDGWHFHPLFFGFSCFIAGCWLSAVAHRNVIVQRQNILARFRQIQRTVCSESQKKWYAFSRVFVRLAQHVLIARSVVMERRTVCSRGNCTIRVTNLCVQRLLHVR